MTLDRIEALSWIVTLVLLDVLHALLRIRRKRKLQELDESWYAQYKTYKFMLDRGIHMPWLLKGIREKVLKLEEMTSEKRPYDWREIRRRIDQKHE